jgi:geranylgeranyl diphosphate synthase, type I
MVIVPPSLLVLADRVEDRLRRLIDAERARWTAIDPALDEPFDSLSKLVLAGGKRLRPAFCHWGFVGMGGDPDDQRVIDAGAAFEMLHAFALFHDDVMDGSATRRGEQTAHLDFAERHQQGQWVGESRRFGEGVAILVGDIAFVYADLLLAGSPAPVWDVWNELRIELNIGQYLDVVGTAVRQRDRVRAERITRYKSGKYTVERPLHLGALLAAPERADEVLEPLSGYGLPLGDAFQLRDDVLGVFGDERSTGKPVGDDLREGKPTPLLAVATAKATAMQLRVLSRVGAADLSDVEVARMQAVIVDTGALTELERDIERMTNDAVAALDKVSLVPEAHNELVALAYYVAKRDR